jgi:hypothetical protein
VDSQGLTVRDVEPIPNGVQIIAVDRETKWRTARRTPTLVRVLRVSEVLDQSTIRSFHEDMKKLNVMRGMMFATTRFSRTATEFAETRPIDLFDREQVQKLLRGVSAQEVTG